MPVGGHQDKMVRPHSITTSIPTRPRRVNTPSQNTVPSPDWPRVHSPSGPFIRSCTSLFYLVGPTRPTPSSHTSCQNSGAATCGLRFAPSAPVRWRSRPRRSLRLALRPPPHDRTRGRDPCPSPRMPTITATAASPGANDRTTSAAEVARRCSSAQPSTPPMTCDVRIFFTAIKGETSRPHRPAELYRYFTKSFESAVLPKCRQFSSHLIGNPGQ